MRRFSAPNCSKESKNQRFSQRNHLESAASQRPTDSQKRHLHCSGSGFTRSPSSSPRTRHNFVGESTVILAQISAHSGHLLTKRVGCSSATNSLPVSTRSDSSLGESGLYLRSLLLGCVASSSLDSLFYY